MGNKIEGQKKYEGLPFEGNTNAIVESRISGETIVPPENKLLSQTPENYIAAREQEKITGNIGTETPPNFPIRGEFEGQPQGQEIETNRDTVNVNRGDIDAGYGTPVPEGIASLQPPSLNKINQMPDQIQGPTGRDKFNIDQGRIQAEENSLMKLMQQRTEGRKKQLGESKEAQNRENWLNVAQLFSRLGSATPRQEGIMGVIGAGLEAADQTLPQIAATNAKFRDERRAIQNDIENDKIDQAQVKLNSLEKRAAKERAFQREELEDLRYDENKKTEELRFNKSYNQKEREINASLSNAGALDINDEKNIDALIKTRYYGGSINADGNLIFAEGESLDKFGNDIAGALSQITGNIMETQGISFNSAQPFISNIKNKIDGVDQDTLKKMMAEYPTLNREQQEKAIQSLADESKLDITIARLLLQR
jgi:hypothetical protein